MLSREELLGQARAIDTSDPQSLEKIADLKRQTTDQEMLAVLDQAAGVIRASFIEAQIGALDAKDPHLLDKIQALKRQTTDDELLALLDKAADGVAGAHFSAWLPRGVVRKLIMLAIVIVVAVALIEGRSLYWLLLLLLLPAFSPRAVGETASFLGMVYRASRS